MDNKQIYTIPSTIQQRSHLREIIESYVSREALSPPLSMEELSAISDTIISGNSLDPTTKGWIMVEINNSLWKETVASIPQEKRILLLPKCLSNTTVCTAETDELGLLCHQCMNCPIAPLEAKAEQLGIMSMVAEGFTTVIGLIENQVVDTVIGVGCLESLEKAFPLLINHAVPGIAIPLNKAGCKNTTVDTGYVEQMLNLRSEKKANLLDYDHLKNKIQEWFTPENLTLILSNGNDHTTTVAREWMGSDGKRWRPYLLAATWMAITGKRDIPIEIQRAAVAVECFHKASLVHDDIQDNDNQRYGKQTIHATYGIPIGINVGDILLGEGYHLLSQCNNVQLMQEASTAHIALCKGQGTELQWSLSPHALTMETVLEIFCNKTVPAFEVSLTMGVICAGGDLALLDALHRYACALGIAYQLQDDIADYDTEEKITLRPSAILAIICREHPGEIFSLLKSKDIKQYLAKPENKHLLTEALDEVKKMAQHYHQEAIASLKSIHNTELKRLLFRVTKKILK